MERLVVLPKNYLEATRTSRVSRDIHIALTITSFSMFSTLSRGSSKVRQSYTRSSCLCNILGHHQAACPQIYRTTRATSSTPFFKSAILLGRDNKAAAPAHGEPATIDDDSASAHGQKKQPKSTTTHTSSSRGFLQVLRESLIAAGEALLPRSQSAKGEGLGTSTTESTEPPDGSSSEPEKKHKSKKSTEQQQVDAVPNELDKKEQTAAAPELSATKDPRPPGQEKMGDPEEVSDGVAVKVKPKHSASQAGKDKKKKKKKKATLVRSVMTTSPHKKKKGSVSSKKLGKRSASEPSPETTISNKQLDDRYLTLHTKNTDGQLFTIRRRKMDDKPEIPDSDETGFMKVIVDTPSLSLKLQQIGELINIPRGIAKLMHNGELTAEEKSVLLPVFPKIVNPLPEAPPISKAKTKRLNRPPLPLGPITATKGVIGEEIKIISAKDLHLVPLDTEPLQVPRLSYGLERVLFNPGVYQLQDPRSKVFNFDPYLQTIMPVNEFDFNALNEYITSSRDEKLIGKAVAEKKKYAGSTSSMTSALTHFHYLLSQWREINALNLSKHFQVDSHNFTALQRSPSAIFLRWRDGAYAIDADKQFDTANILMMLGKSMEKLLTLPTKDFEKYRKSKSGVITERERNADEQFHYTGMGNFLLRSQLDAYDPRIPGTGMFDLKTRSVVSVRIDTANYEEARGYEIRDLFGQWESYEREYFDMIRSAFLKYSLQVRMGRMDGIFVAYHNTERIFGFQYISLPEMDYALHGTKDPAIGDSEFKLSIELLGRVLERATAKWPEQSMRLHFETRDTATPFAYIFAEPMTEDEIERIQKTNKAQIDEFERQVLGLATKDLSVEEEKKEWDNIRNSVEQSMKQDEESVILEEDVKDLEERLETTSLTEDILVAENDFTKEPATEDDDREIMAMTLTIRNKVNGRYVERPMSFTANHRWDVQYSLAEAPSKASAWSLYRATQARRTKAMTKPKAQKAGRDIFLEQIKKWIQKGREYRARMNELEKNTVVKVVDESITSALAPREVKIEDIPGQKEDMVGTAPVTSAKSNEGVAEMPSTTSEEAKEDEVSEQSKDEVAETENGSTAEGPSEGSPSEKRQD